MQDNVRFWEKRRSAACFVWKFKLVSNASVVLFSCVSFVCGYEQNACFISSFVFLRAALCKKQKNHRIVHTGKAQQGIAQVGRTHLDGLRLVLWEGPDGVWSQHIRVACLQVRRTRNGCGLLLCRIDRSDQTAQFDFATFARADWLLHIGVVELMQVGTVHMAQHRVTLTGPKHSGDNDDQAFLLSDGRDANLCCV